MGEMKVKKITGVDYSIYPTGWSLVGAEGNNVYFNAHTSYYFVGVPDLLACTRPLTVKLTNRKELNFPVVE